jgi:hypothetical protein
MGIDEKERGQALLDVTASPHAVPLDGGDVDARRADMTPEKIPFIKEKGTMLMRFPGRVLQRQWKNPIVCDP